jgi:FtsZ-binding cell division protein ZapB
MEKGEELDQFQVLESKLDALIQYIATLKTEKDALAEKLHIQDEKINDLNRENERLRSVRDRAKQRVLSLLEKIEQLDLSS